MSATDLAAIARAMVAPGKGLLAADESSGTIKKRFDSIGLESNEENRRAYRELLFTAPDIEHTISGVILYDETIRQKARDGRALPEVLRARGILPGIKVDKGLVSLDGAGEEKVTEGLDGLAKRYEEYRALGAAFAKWRAVYTVSDTLPTARCIEANAWLLARYAAISQQCGIVPIVEPEVLMDGGHTIERCAEVTEAVLRAVFAQLGAQGVVLEHMVLKPSMVVPGADSPKASPQQVAAASLAVYRRAVPAAVPGLTFLSGGQGDEEATANLDAMNRAPGARPWALSFSYGRALQAPVLKAWRGDAGNVAKAQQALRHRALMNSAAARGEYRPELDRAA
jgi:fructose-bisphosphate aldolase, class I